MDMDRQDPAASRTRRIGLTLYRFISYYGESWARPLTIYLLSALLIGPLYLIAGFIGTGNHHINYRWDWGLPGSEVFVDMLEASAYALAAGGIFQQSLEILAPWGPLLRFANAVWDILLVSLSVVALRRRFHR